MAYSNYLVKVGTYEVPLDYIIAESYKAVIHGQDLDSYTDSNGVTHRNALTKVKPTIEWSFSSITESRIRPILNGIQSQYINKVEKSANVTAFYPEDGKYHTFKCYAPDLEMVIDKINGNTIHYKEVNLKFIAYGGELS